MTVTVNQVDPNSIQVFEDWGEIQGIQFGDVKIHLSDRALDAVLVVASMIQQERAEKLNHRYDPEPQAYWDSVESNCGPEMAGFEHEAA